MTAFRTHAAQLADANQPWPAWLVSTIVHVILIVLLALLAPTRSQGLPDEQQRGVAIALVSRDARDNIQYLDQAAAGNADSTSDQSPVTDALPTAAEQPKIDLPQVALPGSVTSDVASDLLESPDLSGSGYKFRIPSPSDGELIEAERALMQSRGPRGQAVEMSLFGSAPATGRSFVFVIDRSKSMGADGLGALSEARKQLMVALTKLEPVHQFQIIAYHHSRVYLTGERHILPATTDHKRQVTGFISGLASFGGTQHFGALMSALRMRPDVVYFLTDGGDPELDEGQLLQIRRQAGGTATIHCIQFGFGPLQDDDPFMKRLARQNSGGFTYIDMSKR